LVIPATYPQPAAPPPLYLDFSFGNSIGAMSERRAGAPWLILPTYDEAENLEPFVAAVLAKLPAAARVVVVDDNSPDGTGEIADRLAAASERVSVLHRPRKEGLGPAYIAGFREALAGGAGLVLEMDSDFSHDPAYLPRLLDAAGRADLVLGSRYVPGGGVGDWGPLRRAISRGGSAYARRVLGIGVRDLTGGFKCFRRQVLETIDLDAVAARGYAFQVEMTYRAIRHGFSVAEVPIVFRERHAGRSKMDRAIVAEAVIAVPRLRFGQNRVREAERPTENGAILSEVLSGEPRSRETDIQ
jgi:dolichol-phosphate mannosyltransferase